MFNKIIDCSWGRAENGYHTYPLKTLILGLTSGINLFMRTVHITQVKRVDFILC